MRHGSKQPVKPVTKPAQSIVIPVLNEADNILPLIKRLNFALGRRKVEILLIVDGPDQRSLRVVAEARKKYRRQNVTLHAYHRTGAKRWGGLSGSVIDGIYRAASDRIVVMDGDLQHPPEIIPELLRAAKNHDLVIASRYCRGGSASGLSGWGRHVISRGCILLSKLFFPLKLRRVSDPMTGFFVIDRTKLQHSLLRPKGFKILLEIIGAHTGLRITEVPLAFAPRARGHSHGTLKQGFTFLDQLIGLRIRPLTVAFRKLPKFMQFGAIGGSVFAVGLTLLAVQVEVLKIPVLIANAVQLAVTFWLNYSLNRRSTWHDRELNRLAAPKFLTARAATTILNYVLFAWLISRGLPIIGPLDYVSANIVALGAITVLNYIVTDRWAFAAVKPTSKNLLKRRLPRSYYLVALLLSVTAFSLGFNSLATVAALFVMVSLVLFLQACLEVWRIMYAYREPASAERLRFPKPTRPRERFCLLVPARHEQAVIADTLRQLASQNHPDYKVMTVICDDDPETLEAAHSVAEDESRIQVLVYPLEAGDTPSKPKQLNYALQHVKNQGYSVIGVFDAEDSVSPELLRHIDTAFRNRQIGIVQGGVQLMNHDMSWYSLHNTLEYYRWFNGALLFEADNRFIPLGGNTIFIRSQLLMKAGGWPETLTEDCSLGVLLSTRFKARTAVYYEPDLATREETPHSLVSLFRQRTRWNQGFYHEWRKGVWRELPSTRQRLLADYVLISPVLLAGLSLMVPVSLLAALFLQAPVGLVMLMYLPLVPALLHVILNALLLHEFGRAYQRRVKLRHYAVLLSTQVLYQMVLNTAAFWAVLREHKGDYSWYKTPHAGSHRTEQALAVAGDNLD